jgi:cytochrome c2
VKGRGLIIFAIAAALAGAGQVRAQASGDIAKGQAQFENRCSMCHVLGGVGQGPDLVGVVGRRAASVPNFNYTPALTASGLTWTRANLDHFLTDSRDTVPGTAMRVKLSNPDDRHDLVAYLASLHR